MLRLDGARRAPFFDETYYTESTRQTYDQRNHRIERAAQAAGLAEVTDADTAWLLDYFVAEATRSIQEARKQLPAVAYLFRTHGRGDAFPYDTIAELLTTSPCAQDPIGVRLTELPRRVRRRARAFADKLLKRTRKEVARLAQAWEVYAHHYAIDPQHARVSEFRGFVANYARTHCYSSVSGLCGALSNYFRAAQVPDLTRNESIRALLVTKARDDAENSEYRPLYAEDLREMVRPLGTAPLDVRDRLICLLTHYGAFFATDLQALGREVVFRKSYVLLDLDGKVVKVGAVDDPELDVRVWLRRWIELLPPGPGPLFPRMSRGAYMPVALTRACLSEIIRRVARRANITVPHPNLALRKGFAIRANRVVGPVQTARHMRLRRTTSLDAHVHLDHSRRVSLLRMRRPSAIASIAARQVHLLA